MELIDIIGSTIFGTIMLWVYNRFSKKKKKKKKDTRSK